MWLRPSQYGEPYPITRALIEEGRNHLLLGSAIEVGCPVRILQGAQDPDVPWQHAFALAHRLPSDDVVLTMIQDGDHRLSRPQDIARIIAAVAEIGKTSLEPVSIESKRSSRFCLTRFLYANRQPLRSKTLWGDQP